MRNPPNLNNLTPYLKVVVFLTPLLTHRQHEETEEIRLFVDDYNLQQYCLGWKPRCGESGRSNHTVRLSEMCLWPDTLGVINQSSSAKQSVLYMCSSLAFLLTFLLSCSLTSYNCHFFHQPVGVAPLVVIPGNHFRQIAADHLCER